MRKCNEVGNMGNLTIEELASSLGLSSLPEKCRDFFDEVMKDFDKNGCIYTKPEYYEMLHQKYGVLQTYLDLYKKAAIEVGKDESLSRFLALLCRALQDPNFRNGSYGPLILPQKENDFSYEMLPALAAASELELSYEILKKRHLPEDILQDTLRLPENGIPSFMMRHNNRPGYSFLDWFQLAIGGKLFQLGRLQYEIFCGFEGNAYVFRNMNGEEIALAHNLALHQSGIALGSKHFEDDTNSWIANVKETSDSWDGYPVDERGLVRNEIISLSKNEWELALSPGDPVISVHIPANGSLNPESVDESLEKATIFFRKYYPDYEYKAFVCYSWLMDPQLIDLLGPDKNISKFCNRFKKITTKSSGNTVFGYVFWKPDMNFVLEDLPENTSLERAVKKHYQDGKAIYGTTGYFFMN